MLGELVKDLDPVHPARRRPVRRLGAGHAFTSALTAAGGTGLAASLYAQIKRESGA